MSWPTRTPAMRADTRGDPRPRPGRRFPFMPLAVEIAWAKKAR
jgi:hypothetical protein